MLNISVYPSLLGVDPDLDRIIYRSESFNVYFKVEKTPNTHLLTGTRILRRRTAEGLISTSTTRNVEKLKRRVGRLSATSSWIEFDLPRDSVLGQEVGQRNVQGIYFETSDKVSKIASTTI